MPNEIPSAIRDNQGRGRVGDFLKDKVLAFKKPRQGKVDETA